MPKASHSQSMMSGLVDSDSDDQLMESSAMPAADCTSENTAPARKGRARAKAAAAPKTTRTKAPPRRASTRLENKAKPDAASKDSRKALSDRTNQRHASDTEAVDENDDVEMEDVEEASVVAVKETKSKATRKAPVGRGKVAAAAVKRQAQAPPSPVIMETQVPIIDIEEDEEVTQNISRAAQPAACHRRSLSRARPIPAQHRRAGSVSDTERSDPALRRKLGEITKKYENLNVKYQDLREIGLKEGERNFERLRKQTEEKTAASEKLIASLRAEVASQSSQAKESRALKKKVESQFEEMAALKAQLSHLKSSLEDAHLQNKTLSTKLSANRGTPAPGDSATSIAPGTNVGIGAGQAAQLKEDLYGDLTGLIIRGVKREGEEDTYDCIQTGRNGTLHFKLAAVNETSSESYEDAHCQYIPQLDSSRDKALMEILPDYLVDQISFPRPQAAKFYARVVKVLTEKLD